MVAPVADALIDALLAVVPTPQRILNSRDTDYRELVFIDGVLTDGFGFDAQHNVYASMATARLELDLPRPVHVRANATVEIQAGWNDSVDTRFSGRIPAWRGSIDSNDYRLEVNAVGWSSLLAYADRFDLVFEGPITVRNLFNALCARRRVPSYHADAVTSPDGSVEITLGGNRQIDEGRVIIPGGTDPLSFLNSAVEWAHYYVHDTPNGTVRLSRISGRPAGEPLVTFTEGQLDHGDLEAVGRTYDITPKINYHDVRGSEYEDPYGAIVPIRSIAESVPYDPDLGPEGFRYKRTQNSLLVTQEMADIARQVLEIDTSAAATPVDWEAIALPGLSAGDVVAVNAPTVEASGNLWLTGMDVTSTEDDFSARYSGWAGGGEALPHGQDKQTMLLQSGAIHLGDEHVPWYENPAPQGTERSWTFTIPERATAVNIRFLHHGSNSQLLDGVPVNDLTVSRWELWRPGETDAESSGNIAPVPEHYESQLPYGKRFFPITFEDGSSTSNHLFYWSPGAVSLRGTEKGTVTIKLIAGEGDDFEVQQVVVETYGSSEPALPMERG